MSAKAATAVHVDVVSDINCPWCWVGKRAIELAAQRVNGNVAKATSSLSNQIDLRLHWHPFQLTPEWDKNYHTSKAQYYASKFGPMMVKAMFTGNPATNPLVAKGAPMGLTFTYPEGCQVSSSFYGHMLLTYAYDVLAPREGDAQATKLQNDLEEVIFRKYHGEGKTINDKDELASAALEAGVVADKGEALALLQDSHLEQRTEHELNRWGRFVEEGVPHFIFTVGPNGKKQQISGGQDISVFAKLLEKAGALAEKESPAEE